MALLATAPAHDFKSGLAMAMATRLLSSSSSVILLTVAVAPKASHPLARGVCG